MHMMRKYNAKPQGYATFFTSNENLELLLMKT